MKRRAQHLKSAFSAFALKTSSSSLYFKVYKASHHLATAFPKKNTFCYTPMKNIHRNEFGGGEKPRTIVGFYSFLILSPQTEKTFVSIFPPANGRTQSYVFPIRSANIFYNHILYIHISIHKCLISSISLKKMLELMNSITF